MGRRPKPLDPSDPLHAFAIDLRGLRDAAGAAGKVKATCDRVGVNRTTYYAWLAGKQLPGRDILELTVRAWGGDPAYWLERRQRAETALVESSVGGPDESPVGRERGLRGYAQGSSTGRVAEISVAPSFAAARSQRIDEARDALRVMGFDSLRTNERSAYVLLSLLDLGPGQEWAQAQMPALSVREMMEWVSEEYKKVFAPNSRETIRVFTLHQFIDVGLVIKNPDRPDRPFNSSRTCYQLSRPSHALLRSYQTSSFERQVEQYRDSLAGKLPAQ